MARKALLIIDLLNDFMDSRGVLFCGDFARAIIPVVDVLMKKFERKGDLVIFLKDAHTPHDKEFELFAPHAVKGTWGGEIIPELTPSPQSFILEKTRFSSFYNTSLEKVLRDSDIQEVWVTGVCTSICVMDTVGDLRNRDLDAVVPVNAVADFDLQAHEAALKRMERVYGAKLIEV